MNYDVIILGNYTKDTIVSPSGTRHVDGGGFNYGAHVAAMMGLKVGAVTRLAREDERVIQALRAAGIDAYPTFTPDSTIMRLFYPGSNPDERTLTVTKLAGSFTPDQFDGLSARTFLINASTRGEVGLDVVQALKKKGGTLVADAQGFVRTVGPEGDLLFDNWPGREPIISQIDILKTDAVEAEAMTGLSDKWKAATMLASWGPREIVLTDKGGLIVLAAGRFYEAPFLPEPLVGRSGRGDTCISSYACRRLTGSPAEATVWAAAVTTLKMEAEGPIKRPVADAEELIRRKYQGFPK